MSGPLFSSSRFLRYSLVIARVADLGCRHLRHSAAQSFFKRVRKVPLPPAGTRVSGRPRDCSSRSIHVDHRQESATRAKLLSPFPDVNLQHAHYSRIGDLALLRYRPDNSKRRVSFALSISHQLFMIDLYFNFIKIFSCVRCNGYRINQNTRP